MILIRHLTGGRAGSEDRPEAKLDRIVFGRRPNCDVRFPPEETIVAREHFALVRKPPGPSGHWTIELFGEPFVAVDGLAADPGQKLPTKSTFELGKHGGPSFTIEVRQDARADSLAVTDEQEKDEGARVIASKAGNLARLARGVALLGVLFAVIAGGTAAYFHFTQKGAGITGSVRAHLLRAAYLVEAPIGNPEATAFPISAHSLATNAHVGKLFVGLRPGQRMIVRAPGRNGKVYRVTGVKIDAGFDAFQAFLGQDVLRTKLAQLGVPGYDVATLSVKETLPSDAILKLATTAELRSLHPGSLIATAGYPLENVAGSNAQAYGATPELHLGQIAGMTNFFFLPDSFPHDQLIHHDLPTTGGQSGSPIVDQSGEVVALASAANFISPGPKLRIPSGVLINYAQRVDLLKELLAGTAIAQDEKYWPAEFKKFSSGVDIVDRIVTSRIKDQEKNPNVTLSALSNASGVLHANTRVRTAAGKFQRQIEFTVSTTPGAAYAFVAYAHDGSQLQLWLYNGAALLGRTTGAVFAPWITFHATAGGVLNVWLISPADKDVSYTFQTFKLKIPPTLRQATAKFPSRK